ncbi:DNA-binding transcription factor yap1 [Coemansia sp. IMI 209128]|nr:DNA-binding transcription factor yap1 [Coemansia sp. IMI 209128]
MSTADVATAGVTPQKRATSTDGSEDSQDEMYQEGDLHDEKKFKKPGRKPILTEASTKRTAQNRAAQRAFRERKQQYLKGLEEKVKELTEQQERTERENAQLKQCVDQLKEENVTLKSTGTRFTYENVPTSVDFDQAISDLFESSNVPGGLNLTGSYDLQQAALRGADLTKPGAMDAIQPRRDGASPQSVPNMYPNFDLSSSALIQRSGGAMLADHDPLLGVVTSGLSNDVLSGIQMLASNQNISTGSFMSHLFDSPGVSSSSTVPTISPGGMQMTGRSSTTKYSDRDSRSPSVPTTAVTPGDMFVPLSSLSGAGSANGIFGMDSFQGQNGFAQLASLIQQQSSSPVSSQNPALTPSLSELFTLSPSQMTTDGLLSFIPPALTTGTSGNNGLTTGMFSMANSGPAASLPSLLQQSAAYQAPQHTVADTNMLINGGRSSSPVLPARLMAYRNPDPLLGADDGDQLEKLLLSSMYPVAPAAAPPVEDAQPAASGEAICACRNCDMASCPKHGSPGDMSEEMREMAPQLLSYVCNETNTMADEELNDLCSLMYKHAKCSDIQKRVEMVREKIKADSELEMFQTKQKLAKQYGLQ